MWDGQRLHLTDQEIDKEIQKLEEKIKKWKTIKKS